MNAAAPRPRALFLSNLAWDYLWQRHQSMASLFARDYDVVYCELPGLRRAGWQDAGRIWRRFRHLLGARSQPGSVAPAEGVTLARPFVVPSTNAVWHALNRVLLKRFLRRCAPLAGEVDVIVTYTAARAALHLISRVRHRILIYDCTDNFRAISRLPACFAADETRLLRDADLTIAPGSGLAQLHRATARRIEVVPHGALIDRFLLPPADAATPITLIYYGHIYTQHLDIALIAAMAHARADWRIVLVGPVLSAPDFPANVVLHGAQPHERLRDFLREAHVIILPYARNDYTRTVVPAKTYECLATGRPIVATPLPELQASFSPLIDFAVDAAGFITAIERALRDDTPERRAARIAAARANSWEERYARVRQLLTSAAPA